MPLYRMAFAVFLAFSFVTSCKSGSAKDAKAGLKDIIDTGTPVSLRVVYAGEMPLDPDFAETLTTAGTDVSKICARYGKFVSPDGMTHDVVTVWGDACSAIRPDQVGLATFAKKDPHITNQIKFELARVHDDGTVNLREYEIDRQSLFWGSLVSKPGVPANSEEFSDMSLSYMCVKLTLFSKPGCDFYIEKGRLIAIKERTSQVGSTSSGKVTPPSPINGSSKGGSCKCRVVKLKSATSPVDLADLVVQAMTRLIAT